MEQEKPLSGYKYQMSPKYNNFELKSLKTPQISTKNESSEMILSQTKESLHNFLTNLKKSSILKENLENKNINAIPKYSGLSNNSNIKEFEDIQDSYEKYNNKTLSKLTDNNLETNILNYNKIYNTNNVYNLGNNSSIKNRPRLRVNKKLEPLFQEKLNTENDLNLYLNNNLYNAMNTSNKKTDYHLYNSAKRTKYNFSLGKNVPNSEENKNTNNKLAINLIEKIKVLKSENSQNKKDIINLSKEYNEMQTTLLEKITTIINEKDNKIKELGNKIEEMEKSKKEEHKDKDLLLEKNKKLIKDIESLNKEITKLNKNNQELQNTIKNKNEIIKKCNEEIKEMEEKLSKISNLDIIKYELKEKEDELNNINSDVDNKLKSYQVLLLEYKKKNDELFKENKSINGLNTILKSQKKSLTKENATNKQIVEELKIENEKLIKERDEYKIKKEQLINEIEIIKLNNDRIYNIKTLTNNNTNRLKNEISSLKKEKEILGEKNEELEKRIKSLDRKNSKQKTLKAKSKTVSNLNKDKLYKFINLKIIKIKELTLPINNNTKNKNSNKKNTPKKIAKKIIVNKFKKLSISNKVVEVYINKKSGTSSKKPVKKINKFKKLIQCSKIVNVLIKNIPKPPPKPKKKKFLKLKSINGVVNICLKSKINNRKFKSNKLKISSTIKSFNINSFNQKKKVDLKISKSELSFLERTDKKEDNKIKEEIKNEIKEENKDIVFIINKLDNIKLEGKIKLTTFDIKKIECFSLKEKEKKKTSITNLLIGKNESITYNNQPKIDKKINLYSIDNNNHFNLLSKIKTKKEYEVSKNNFFNYNGLKRCFNNIENKSINFFAMISKPIVLKKIYEISEHMTLYFIKKDKKVKFDKEEINNFMYVGVKKIYNLKKENNSSLCFKPKKKGGLLSRSVTEQNNNQNKPKLYSFFSSFLKGKKSNLIPMRILQVQYKRNKKDKIVELNKKNFISSQNQFNYLPIEIKKKEIKYLINNAFSFNFEKVKRIPNYNIININSFYFEPAKKKIDLSSIYNPELLKGEENLKQLISQLNNEINLKNEEIKKLEKDKADIETANQLFNDSSNEQIESLSKSVSILKEKNEKLNEEIEKLKEEINNNKKMLEEKNKEFDENKNNLNKTIDELTKENSKLKLDLFKRGTESESTPEKKQEEKNDDNVNDDKIKEYEKQIETLKEDLNKMRQSKIIETNQLKLEITKNKVEMKRLTNQIKKLETEKNEPKKDNEDDIPTLKINDINSIGSNPNDKAVSDMKKEIENYKSKLSEMNIEVKKNEELRHQNILLAHKLQEASKKVALANQVISKAKKYSLCLAYISQFLGIIKPENEKQIYLVNKLKEFVDEYQKEKTNKKSE